MMKKNHFLIFIAAMAFVAAPAQVRTYTFQNDGATFPYLAGSGAIVTEHAVEDDMVSPAIVTLPFTFRFGGQNQSTVGISENGFVWFGPAQPMNIPFIAPISSTQSSLVKGIISAMGIDLHPIDTPLAKTKISSAVIGQAPNRTFVIEWFGTSRIDVLDDPAGCDIIDFQIRLSETSHKVEIVYGRTILNSDLASNMEVGLKTTDTDFNIRTTEGALWSDTNEGTALDNTCLFSKLSKPAFGQKLVWQAATLGVSDFINNQVVLYPNPAADQLHVGGLTERAFDYTIYDVTGRTIRSQKAEGAVIALDGLSAGEYIVSITSDNTTVNHKFIKI